MYIDLSILSKKPDKDKQVILTIEPLAPLSIVSTLPGSYYKSLDKPTKANLCGMFENVMGWHIGKKDRSKIFNEMKKVYKKSYKITDFEVETSAVGYTSLLGHLFEVQKPYLQPAISVRYEDIWKQQLYRDGYAHPNGTPNLSYQLIPLKRQLDKKENGTVTNNEITKFHKKHKGGFPMYYTSPRKREYIVLEGNYMFKLSMNSQLFEILSTKIAENNIAYLGSNEGWINLKIEAL